MNTAKERYIDFRDDDTKEFSSHSTQRASVYISYAPADEAAAERLCTAFEARGTPCWFSARDLTSSMVWPQCVVEAIESSNFFVLLLTENARASEDVVPEIAEAKASGRSIIVLQSVDKVLNPEIESMLTSSRVLPVSADLTDEDIDRTWSQMIDIETDDTRKADESLALALGALAAETANSYLIKFDCIRGNVSGKTSCQMGVGDRLVFGRGSEADIHVDDKRASRRHAGLILKRDPKYGLELQLMDLMSRNGTWVRYPRDGDADISKLLEHSQTRIESGAIIRIGSTDLRLTAVPIPTHIEQISS